MTRINLGIFPEELCDAHLLAEYRELPRMCAFAVERVERYGYAGPRPYSFRLGTGHMAFFLPYGLYLSERWESLRSEMLYRGFVPTLRWRGYPPALVSADIGAQHTESARPLLIERIRSRIATAKRKPVWTRRTPPEWAQLLRGYCYDAPPR